jgi:hypothetical protein
MTRDAPIRGKGCARMRLACEPAKYVSPDRCGEKLVRLTLRTLLAYLDDILDANQTKEIGARISENTVASSLVSRIRDVTRRRRIASPELSGPGSTPDPNVVAEYLDNTLDPAAVGDLERVCLDSDVHLAEVAACHQILTIVLGEPVTIRPELRERMYAMGAVTPDPVLSNSTPTVPYAVGSAKPAAQRRVVPDYLKRPPLWKKVAPVAVVGLLIAGWAYLVGDFFRDGESNAVATAPAAKKPSEPATRPSVAASPDAAADGNRKPAADLVARAPMLDVDTVAPMPDTAIPSEPMPPTEPVGDAVAAASSKPAVGGPEAAIPAPPAPGITASKAEGEASPFPAPTVMYASNEGVLIYRPRGRADWTVLPRRALLHVGDEIASPEPFVSELQVSAANDPAAVLRISLQGRSRIRLLPSTEHMLAEIEINRGRVAVYRPVDGIDHALGVGVTVNGTRTEFDAVSPQTRFGLWVTLPLTQGPPPIEPWPAPLGTLFVTSGSVNIRRQGLPPLSSSSSVETLDWTVAAKDDFEPATIPPWLDPEYRPVPSAKTWAKFYEAEFNLDQPVQNSIVPVIETDKRGTVSRFATQTMALIDDVSSLVRALTSQHEETRHDAIVGLKEWMMMSPDHAPRLDDEVSRGFRDEQANIVRKLLWGITDAEAHDEAASMQLIDWMASDEIAIRELAFFEVYRVTLRDMQYRPQNTESQRDSALMRWRELVRRNKGLLPTAAAEPMP